MLPAADVRARCGEHGIRLLGVNTVRGDVAAGENGLGALPGREAEFAASVDQSIAFCVAAGGSAIHCMAGVVAPEQRAAARDVLIRNLQDAARKAAAHDLTLLLEPLNPHDAPGYFYSTQAAAADIIAAVGAPNLKLMFDVYHVGVTEGDVLRKLEHFMPLIGHIQIAAVPSRTEPDEGEIAYRAILDRIAELGYAGWIGCEYKPRGDTDEGMKWTAALGVTL